MAQNIATLAVKFTADTSGLKAGADKAAKIFDDVGKSPFAKGFTKKLDDFRRAEQSALKNAAAISANRARHFTDEAASLTGTSGLLGALRAAGPAGLALAGSLVAVGAGAIAAYKGMEQFIASATRIDAMNKLATRLDMTYVSIQKLSFVAGRSGVEIDALARAMEHMARTTATGGDPLDVAFGKQAKRISEIKDPALRAAEAYKVFGKAGTELIPLLGSIAKDAERFKRFNKSFNLGISEADSQGVEKMNDAFGDLIYIPTQLTDKLVSKFGAPIAALLENVIIKTEEWASHLESLGVTWDDVGGFAINVISELNLAFSYLNSSLQITIGGMERIYGMLQKMQASGLFGMAGKMQATMSVKEANDLITSGEKLTTQGTSGIIDIISGKTSRKFFDSIVNGNDFAKRGPQGRVGALTKTAVGADKFSQEAARIISGAGMSQAEKDAAATAKNTAAMKDGIDRLGKVFAGDLPVLALGGI